MDKLIVYLKCSFKSIGKILGGVAVAVLSFYCISWIERSFQIEIVPLEHEAISYSALDENYEVKFYLYNKGWSDRTLVGVDVFEKRVSLKGKKSISVELKKLLEMKDKNFPLALPKQSYTEIRLDKLSSYYVGHSNSLIRFYFDKGLIEATKDEVTKKDLIFYTTVNDKLYTGDTKYVLDALTLLTQVDRILKLDESKCPEDVEKLILERENLKNLISQLKFFNKSARYKKLNTSYFQFSAINLINLDFFKTSKLGPIKITGEEFNEISPWLTKLYFIDKLIAGKRCKSQLTLYDRYYSQSLSAYADKIKINTDQNSIGFSD